MTKARDLANAGTALTTVSATELGYLDGVTSAVQTQIDAKLASSTAATTYQAINTNVSTTELGYLDGVTSAIQTQLNQKPEVAAGKNLVINGGMDNWQRGTSFTALANVYTADRWNVLNTGLGGTYTASRVSSWLNGFNYAYRLQRNSGTTTTSPIYLSMAFEGDDFVRFTGGKVTLSFYARKGADYSPTSSNWNVFSEIGTDANGALYTALTGGIAVLDQNVVLTTGGTRYSFTFDVPSGYRACRLQMSMTGVGTAGTNDWMEITGVQMEQGSVATPFSRAGGSIGGELALCQRYYYRVGGDVAFQAITGTFAKSTTQAEANIYLPVTMRIPASSVDYSTLGFYDGTTITAINSVSINGGQTGKQVANIVFSVASGLTQFRPYQILANNSTSGYLALNAEL